MTTSTATISRYRNSLANPPYSMYSLPFSQISELLSQTLPEDVTVLKYEEISTSRLRRLYAVNLSNSSKMLLTAAPSPLTRLLRHEQNSLRSEATMLSFVGDSIGSQAQPPPAPLARTPSPGPSSALKSKYQSFQISPDLTFGQLVPRVVTHSDVRDLSPPFSVWEKIPQGTTLSAMAPSLSPLERQDVDRQLGAMMRNLAHIVSPSERFGPIGKVHPQTSRLSPPLGTTSTPGSPPNAGSTYWSSAFQNLLEGILRDAEDISLLLPYGDIRRHFARLAILLDEVTLPRLLIIDAGQADNLIVAKTAVPEPRSRNSQSAGNSPTATTKVQISGLRDWSQGIFGDPLLATCFVEPSKGFIEGWRLVEGLDEEDEDLDDIFEEDGARVRILLYRCYHAIVSIVTESYRPRPGSTARELEARRKLTSAVTELKQVEIRTESSDDEDHPDGRSETTKRSRSPSAALTDKDAIKRAKLEEEERASSVSDSETSKKDKEQPGSAKGTSSTKASSATKTSSQASRKGSKVSSTSSKGKSPGR